MMTDKPTVSEASEKCDFMRQGEWLEYWDRYWTWPEVKPMLPPAPDREWGIARVCRKLFRRMLAPKHRRRARRA